MVRRRVTRSARQTLARVIAAWLVVSLLVAAQTAGAAAPGRAWELVTAGETNGSVMLGARAWTADGDRIVFSSFGPLPGAPAGDLAALGVATRTPAGWTAKPVSNAFTATSLELEFPQLLAVSPSLSVWLWASALPLLPGAPSTPEVGLYNDAVDGPTTLVGGVGLRTGSFRFEGASDDMDEVAFDTQTQLLAADSGRLEGSAAYAFDGSTLRLVGVDDGGTPISACGSSVGSGDYDPARARHAVSRDGRRIVFTAPATWSFSCGEPRHVYVREDGVRTIDVSASRCERPDCNARQDVTFAGATPDGSTVFLVTSQQLTDDDVDEGVDLYSRSLADGSLTRLSAGPPGVVANVSSLVVRASDDGTRVFFVAYGALAPGAVADRANLYVSDHGAVRLVAAAVDDVDVRGISLTSDGGSLLFATASALLASDVDVHPDVYRYDVAAGVLTHVSDGVGGRGNGAYDATLPQSSQVALPGAPMRYQSEDGRRLSFGTAEPLLPEDHDDAFDVYERVDGQLTLVTQGADGDTLSFEGVSADGRSVFVRTAEGLVPADDDGDPDIYAARLGGGFPPAPPPAPGCAEDACQGPVSGRLPRPLPASATVQGERAPRAAFGVRPLSAKTRRRLAATGRATVTVDAPARGRLSLVVRMPARDTRHGRRRSTVVARTDVTVRRAGAASMRIRLSRAARSSLRRRGSLALTLAVRHSTAGAAAPVSVKLVWRGR